MATMSRRVRAAAAVAALAVGMAGAIAATSSSAAPTTSGAPAVSSVAAVVASWPGSGQSEAPCLEGASRVNTLMTQSFESGITEPRFASGFAASTATGASAGSYAARAVRAGSGASAYFYLPYVRGTPGTETRLAFAHRGNASSARNVVAVNSFGIGFSTTTSWGGTSFDITAATRDEGGWLGTWFQHNVTTGTNTYLSIDNVQIFTCRPNATERVAGSSRYATAALISAQFAPGAPTVFIARGDTFPDALSASARGAATDSPVLLTRPTELPAETAAALRSLQPAEIVILGNEGSVSAEVEGALAGYAPTVRRLGGADRYETSALIGGEFPEGAPVAFLSTGLNFADAMTGGGLAGHLGGPLLLTRSDRLPDSVAAELARLQPAEIVILGSDPTVSNAVLAEAGQYASSVRRIAGPNRYETASLIAAEYPRAVSHTYLATGVNFPDGLAAGALAGSQGVPLLISPPAAIPSGVMSRLTSVTETRGYLLGMQDALSSLVRDQYGRTLP